MGYRPVLSVLTLNWLVYNDFFVTMSINFIVAINDMHTFDLQLILESLLH